MKKYLLLYSVLFFFLFEAIAGEYDDTPLHNGFYIKAGLNMPTKSFSDKGPLSNFGKNTSLAFSSGIHFELGSRFYIGPAFTHERFRFGIDLSWLSINSTTAKSDISKISMINLQPLKVGPLLSFAITDEMAIDIKYSFVPTITILYEDEIEDDNYTGGLHEVEFEYRWKVLMLGIAHQFGSLSPGEIGTNLDGIQANTHRFFIGIKF